MDKNRKQQTDHAVFNESLKGGVHEPTYSGVLSFMRRRYSRDLTNVDLVVWGIPFDAAVSNRPGTRFGPQGIRRASAIFDGDPQYPFNFDPYEILNVVDYGDCVFDYGYNQDAPQCIETQAREILQSGAHLFSFGGDHFVTYPLLKVHHEKYGSLALVQFDAHQDTWDDDGGRIDHGTFVERAVNEGLIDPSKSIQVGIRTHAPKTCGLDIIYGEEVDSLGVDGIVNQIKKRVGDSPVYLTFDIDCLDPAFAPGTGTPVSGGLTSREAMQTVRSLGSLNLIGGDVVEVAPAYDHADITSIAASTIAQTYVGIIAEKKRNSSTS